MSIAEEKLNELLEKIKQMTPAEVRALVEKANVSPEDATQYAHLERMILKQD